MGIVLSIGSLAGFSCASSACCELACCMAVCGLQSLASAALGAVARFAHVLFYAGSFFIAAMLGLYGVDEIMNPSNSDWTDTGIDFDKSCDEEHMTRCHYRQMIYRMSIALVCTFGFLTLFTPMIPQLNSGAWPAKVMMIWGVFIGLWWIDNDTISTYAYAAAVLSFFYMLLQSLFVLDIAHDLHTAVFEKMEQAEKEGSGGAWKIMYIFLSLGGFTAAIAAITASFIGWGHTPEGQAFSIITIIALVLTTGLSLVDRVGGGILTPALMNAYISFLCWYSLSSYPEKDDESTSLATDSTSSSSTSSYVSDLTGLIITVVITFVIMGWLVMGGVSLMTILDASEGTGVITGTSGKYTHAAERRRLDAVLTGRGGNDVETSTMIAPSVNNPAVAGVSTPPLIITQEPSSASSSGDEQERQRSNSRFAGDDDAIKFNPPPKERFYFHLMMTLASAYGAVILAQWGAGDGSDEGSMCRLSMWLKIVVQWLSIIAYMRVLQLGWINGTA